MMPAARLEQGIRLAELLDGLVDTGNDTRVISGLCLDSRKVKPGDLFCARKGSRVNAADYIAQAVGSGAVAVLLEDATPPGDLPRVGVPVFSCRDFARILGEVASRFFWSAVGTGAGRGYYRYQRQDLHCLAAHPCHDR